MIRYQRCQLIVEFHFIFEQSFRKGVVEGQFNHNLKRPFRTRTERCRTAHVKLLLPDLRLLYAQNKQPQIRQVHRDVAIVLSNAKQGCG